MMKRKIKRWIGTAGKLVLLLLLSTMLLSQGATAFAASAPNWSNNSCYGTGNPLTANYQYQCTWYVWGRVRELTGIKMSGLVNRWVEVSSTKGYMSTPPKGQYSVGILHNSEGDYKSGDKTMKHVLFVESYDGTNITWSEGNCRSLVSKSNPQGYRRMTKKYSDFLPMAKSGSGAKKIQYVPLGPVSSDQKESTDKGTVSLTVKTSAATNITKTNAKLNGSVTKTSGTTVSSCGIYLGTSAGNMTKRNSESLSAGVNSHNSGKGFNIWYDLTDELKITLKPGTTYYYKIYCICNGKEYCGSTVSFKTLDSTRISNYKSYVVIPGGYGDVPCYESVDSTAKYRHIVSSSSAYRILSTKYADLSNGKRRFYFTDSAGRGMWFDNNSRFTVTYYMDSISLTAESVTVEAGRTVSGKWNLSPASATEPIVARDISNSSIAGISLDASSRTYTIYAKKAGTMTFRLAGSYSGIGRTVRVNVTASGSAAKSSTSSTGNAVKNAIGSTSSAAKSTGSSTSSAAKSTGSSTSSAAKSTGSSTSSAAKSAGSSTSSAAKSSGNSTGSAVKNASSAAKNTGYPAGTVISTNIGVFKITASGARKEMCYQKAPKGARNMTVPDQVHIGSDVYYVTEIAGAAFKDCRSLRKVVVGSYVEKIGENAFKNCGKLTKITMRGNQLKKVGKGAISKISRKAVIKVPASAKKRCKKLFTSRTGFKKTMKIK